MTTLDLTTSLEAALPAAVVTHRFVSCCVVSEARLECCHRTEEHAATLVLYLQCGCSYPYCRSALMEIYGPVKMTHGRCVVHDLTGIVDIERLR